MREHAPEFVFIASNLHTIIHTFGQFFSRHFRLKKPQEHGKMAFMTRLTSLAGRHEVILKNLGVASYYIRDRAEVHRPRSPTFF